MSVIRSFYVNPQFRIKDNQGNSQYYKQRAGIRQGCPLSPYLFIILMTCLLHDVHDGDKLRLREQRIVGTMTDEVLYADDAICMTQDEEAIQRLLKEIEALGHTYGLRLNRGKCEFLSFDNTGTVTFHDGTAVPSKREVKYVGCHLNDKADPQKEIKRRIK